MPRPHSLGRFLGTSAVVWLIMIVVLVLVPDGLERWMSLEVARVIGWAVAMSVWVVAVEAQWRARFGPLTRFMLQLCLWITAALIAIWISEQARWY